jgi:Mg2+ and Co2+ transporter CorA
LSNQAQARDLFKMLTSHLGTDQLYTDVSEAVREMNQYLDSDDLRRQANTVTRLTVVTTLSVIGTVATGFLGMNLFAEADQPAFTRLMEFLIVFIPTVLLTLYTVAKSKALAEFLDNVSNERLRWPAKLEALLKGWKKKSLPR